MAAELISSTKLKRLPGTHIDLYRDNGFFRTKEFTELYVQGVKIKNLSIHGDKKFDWFSNFEVTSTLFAAIDDSLHLSEKAYRLVFTDEIDRRLQYFDKMKFSPKYDLSWTFESTSCNKQVEFSGKTISYIKICLSNSDIYFPDGQGILFYTDNSLHSLALTFNEYCAIKAEIALSILSGIIELKRTKGDSYWSYDGILKFSPNSAKLIRSEVIIDTYKSMFD